MICWWQINPIRKALIILVFLAGFFYTNNTSADTKSDSLTFFLNQIAEFPSKSDSSDMIPMIRKIWQPALKFVDDYENFASDSVLNIIEKETRNRRLDVYKTIFPLINSRNDTLKGEAAAALAYYHYHPAAQRLSSFANNRLKAVLFSILEYDGGLEWGMNYYNRIASENLFSLDSIYIDKISVLNLIYFLNLPRSLPFLNHIIDSDKDLRVQQKALEIKARLAANHPELVER